MIRMWSANYNEKTKEVFHGIYDGLHSLSHTKWNCKYRNRLFWSRGYYVDAVRKNSKAIGECARNQLKEDYIAEKFELEWEDSFTGKRK